MLKKALLFCVFITLFSCDSKTVFSSYSSISNGEWDKDNVVSFAIKDIDTLAKHNAFINIRNDKSYAYSNLHLIIAVNYPNGNVVKDTLEYQMAKPNGEFLGEGYASVKENKLWYPHNIDFSTFGVYTIEISHAMRRNGVVSGVSKLEGITDVGFQIEKIEK